MGEQQRSFMNRIMPHMITSPWWAFWSDDEVEEEHTLALYTDRSLYADTLDILTQIGFAASVQRVTRYEGRRVHLDDNLDQVQCRNDGHLIASVGRPGGSMYWAMVDLRHIARHFHEQLYLDELHTMVMFVIEVPDDFTISDRNLILQHLPRNPYYTPPATHRRPEGMTSARGEGELN